MPKQVANRPRGELRRVSDEGQTPGDGCNLQTPEDMCLRSESHGETVHRKLS